MNELDNSIFPQGLYLIELIVRETLMILKENGFITQDTFSKAIQEERKSKQILDKLNEQETMISPITPRTLKEHGVWAYESEKFVETCKRLQDEDSPQGNRNRVVYREIMSEIHQNMKSEAASILESFH